jgi:hypothetical protein
MYEKGRAISWPCLLVYARWCTGLRFLESIPESHEPNQSAAKKKED